MKIVIKVEDNLKEILQYLEDLGYNWLTGSKPTEFTPILETRYIIPNEEFKTIEYSSFDKHDNYVTLNDFIASKTMNRNNILVGYKLTLENGATFEVFRYKDEKILFPVGCHVSIISLDELCNHDLSPVNGASRIMKIENSLGVTMWERKFTRSDIKAGYVLKNDNDVEYLVVSGLFEGLRIIPIGQYTIGALVVDLMNEDMSPATPAHSEIIEVKDTTGKVVYSK